VVLLHSAPAACSKLTVSRIDDSDGWPEFEGVHQQANGRVGCFSVLRPAVRMQSAGVLTGPVPVGGKPTNPSRVVRYEPTPVLIAFASSVASFLISKAAANRPSGSENLIFFGLGGRNIFVLTVWW
jgi:hypothetical protein